MGISICTYGASMGMGDVRTLAHAWVYEVRYIWNIDSYPWVQQARITWVQASSQVLKKYLAYKIYKWDDCSFLLILHKYM